MYLQKIDYLKKHELDSDNPRQNHYKFIGILGCTCWKKYLIITDSKSDENLWKIFLTPELAAQVVSLKPGEWFYIVYIPRKTAFKYLDSNHLLIKRYIATGDISDCEIGPDDL